MNQSPQTGNRIVSKSEYAKVQATKARLWLKAVLMVLIGVGAVAWEIRNPNIAPSFTRDVLIFIWALIAFGLIREASRTVKRISAIEPVVPLTRTNTSNLPAPESLVRASEEPKQVQESVLLRAATEIHETPSEQLMRASRGPEAQ